MIELLAPAGNFEKLNVALHFGADAIYLAGKKYGLRAFADNFDREQLLEAVNIVHEKGKKIYVTVNVFAYNDDFVGLDEYLVFLQDIGVDAIIVSDPGIFSLAKQCAPRLKLHVSTQANITNKYSALFWANLGAERIVLARELSLQQIREIKDSLPPETEIEAFVHGAMCISYSGRCLLSNFLANRPSNHGECVQSCRWNYALMEQSREGEYYPIQEDERGSYILNSKDMNMIDYIDKLSAAGITSFKIEGRIKSSYYVGGVVDAYRRAINLFYQNPDKYIVPESIKNDLDKISHRLYCTGFYLGEKGDQCYETSKPKQKYEFSAMVIEVKENGFVVEMRNRFKIGDQLEILSSGKNNGRIFQVEKMYDSDSGDEVIDAIKVQQKIHIMSDIVLEKYDILRKLT